VNPSKAHCFVEIDPLTGEEIGPAPDDFLSDWPDDEYDRYVWRVLSLLSQGASATLIGHYMDDITTSYICKPWKDVAAMRAWHRELAERIVRLRVERDA
jgi:hypothetical protein